MFVYVPSYTYTYIHVTSTSYAYVYAHNLDLHNRTIVCVTLKKIFNTGICSIGSQQTSTTAMVNTVAAINLSGTYIHVAKPRPILLA